jgi:subtilisin family serine protease
LRLLVGFDPTISQSERREVLDRLGLKAIEKIDSLDAVLAEALESSLSLSTLKDRASIEPSLALLEEDLKFNALSALGPSFQSVPLPSWDVVWESIPHFKKMLPAPPLPPALSPEGLRPVNLAASATLLKTAGSEIPWGVVRVNAPAVWGRSEGEATRVAVIDTGIDPAHLDLKDNLAGGYNALGTGPSTADDNGHGTHVAGIIAAARDGRGVAGVAPRARLLAVKAMDSQGNATLLSLIKALVWCAHHDVQVANMSLTAPASSVFLRLAVKYASLRGVTIVAAAGNDSSSLGYPALYPEVIAVSALDGQDRIAGFSGRGPKIDFIAPGVGIKSTYLREGFEWLSGSSLAAPHVSGLAALAISLGAREPAAVRRALERAAKSLGLNASEQGHGLIDASLIVPDPS